MSEEIFVVDIVFVIPEALVEQPTQRGDIRWIDPIERPRRSIVLSILPEIWNRRFLILKRSNGSGGSEGVSAHEF
jgi:hypothetical protein